jgi:hypothetical protein
MLLFYVIGFIALIFAISKILPSIRYPASSVKASDGKSYIVRDMKDKQDAADRLAKIRSECFRFRDRLGQIHPDDERTKRMLENLTEDGTIFSESTPDSNFTSHTKNKGEAIIFCLRQRNSNEDLVDHNTMMFVAIHELGHVVSKTVGHNDEFWTNFRWLLKIAEKEGFYNRIDYSKLPQEYCGMTITDNPAID